MDHLISIIVPVYNAEKYIQKCVESIQNQTVINWELILVNDGSNDNSLLLCQKLESSDKRIRVLNKENGGASSARNAGLDVASGDYVVFIDADDYVSSHYVEYLYETARSSGCDIIQCDLKRVIDEPIDKDNQIYSKTKIEIITKEEALNKKRYKVCIWGKIYSKALFASYRFPEGIIYEDDASYYKLVYLAKKVGLYKEILYFYYMSANSVMRNQKKEKSLDFITIYEERIAFFEARKEWKLVQGSFIRYCIVLMLFIAEATIHKHNQNDIPMLLEKYKHNYEKIDKKADISFAESILLACYRKMPMIMNPIIAFLRR